MSAFVKTTRVHYSCRDRTLEPIGSRNYGEQELVIYDPVIYDPVIYDPVGLPESHGQVETDETENWNGTRKAESWNGKLKAETEKLETGNGRQS